MPGLMSVPAEAVPDPQEATQLNPASCSMSKAFDCKGANNLLETMGGASLDKRNGRANLFQEGVLEEESARVAVRSTAVRVSGLVECLPKDLAAEGHPAADEDAGEFAELDVSQAVPAEGERPAVSQRDVARRSDDGGDHWCQQLGR